MIYYIVFLLLLCFSLRYDINGKTKYRNECYFVILIALILIAGLRYRLGVDTTRYCTAFYYFTPELGKIMWSDLSFGKDPLFKLMNSVVLSLGGKFYIVQLLQAAFVNILLFSYFKKHTSHIFICVFFYFIWQYCLLNMEEMRASMSLAVCLFANDYMLEKKWLKGLFLYTVGCMFHASTIVVMLMPLFFFLRFNRTGVLILVLSLVFGMIARPFIEEYLTIMEFGDAVNYKVSTYLENDNMMEGNLNVFGYLYKFLIYGYPVISLLLIKYNNGNKNLLKLEPLIMIYLMIAMLSLSIPILYRFERFYVIYCILFVSEISSFLFRYDSKRNIWFIYGRAIVIILPLFFVIIRQRLSEKTWVRYHPYASVIEKGIDRNRERVYSTYEADPPIKGKY